MSIRLRLTLLYSVILALTLTSFSAMLYGWQSQSLRSAEERLLADAAHRIPEFNQLGDRPFEGRPFPQRGDEPPNRRFGGRTLYVQILNSEGNVIVYSENLEEVVLPFSDAGQEAVRNGEPWVETAVVEDEHLLIHSEPVIIEGQVTKVVQVARSLADQDQYLNTLGTSLLIGSGAAVIIAFGIGWVLSGLALRPIHRITQTARTIGAERDLNRRVQYLGPNDELGQLATTFNAMLTELEVAYQQQQQFVADVSHELRTPLTTLRGNLALLRREPAIRAEERADILDDMVGESERLIRLVNDLLMLARADARQPLRSGPFRVKPLIEDVCRQTRLLAPDRSITCAQLPDVIVVGDRDALKQVLLILMDNALRHTTGAITVSAEVVDEHVAMSVYDTGPGIEPELLPHIFERFHCGKSASTESSIGLGLAIARALVEAQNGTIAVESQVGQGSVFTVTLPQAAVHREASP
jgi:two-component system OmpR family sensor kinase